MPDKIRVAQRFKLATKLRLGPAKVDDRASAVLARSKLTAKNRGDLQSAALSAGYYAKKTGRTMFIYPGNSYGHFVWRVSDKPSEYLNPINNTGDRVYSVTPELVCAKHEVSREQP